MPCLPRREKLKEAEILIMRTVISLAYDNDDYTSHKAILTTLANNLMLSLAAMSSDEVESLDSAYSAFFTKCASEVTEHSNEGNLCMA